MDGWVLAVIVISVSLLVIVAVYHLVCSVIACSGLHPPPLFPNGPWIHRPLSTFRFSWRNQRGLAPSLIAPRTFPMRGNTGLTSDIERGVPLDIMPGRELAELSDQEIAVPQPAVLQPATLRPVRYPLHSRILQSIGTTNMPFFVVNSSNGIRLGHLSTI